MPDLSAPAAPAPSAPAPAAPSAPAPVAAPAPAAPAAAPAPVAPAAPAPVVAPAAPAVAAPAAPAKFDPQTSAVPPKSSDYGNDSEGLAEFISANTAWSMAHPDEAAKIRTDKLAAEETGQLAGEATPAEASVAEAVRAAEGDGTAKVDDAKPADAAPVAGATPALIDAWKTDSPELAAAFEKYPEKYQQIMETARAAEAAKPVLDIVSTPEEAQFAVEHAQRLVANQTSWMLAGEDPEMVGPAWEQTIDFFKERDAEGKEVLDADGKAKLGADFKPFVRKAAGTAMEDFTQSAQATISALEAKLAGNYPNDEARAADTALLENAKYEKAAFDFVLQRLANPAEAGATTLPALPANATPEQIAFQKQLETQQAELNAQSGKQTQESRRAATAATNRDVQNAYEAGVNRSIESHIAAMKERGEYLPEFVLTDKWVNPQTGQPTKVSAFGARVYLALNAKINNNPLHAAKLGSLEAMGAKGKDARLAEITRLQGIYLKPIIEAEVQRIQDGIRASHGQAKPNAAAGVARVEPQSQGTVAPSTLDAGQVRTWAEGEAAKQPGYEDMDGPTRETLIISLAAKKRFGG